MTQKKTRNENILFENTKNILFTKELQNIVWKQLTLKEGILRHKTTTLKAKK